MNTKLIEKYYNSDEYLRKLRSRAEITRECNENEFARHKMILDYWSVNPIEFIETIMWLQLPNYNNAVKPFFLFDYQKRIINKIWEAEQDMGEHEILIDKPREMGVTWTILAYFYWRWMFTHNWSGLLTSRSESEVDKGDKMPNESLFGKLRWCTGMTPKWLLEGFRPKGEKGTSTDMKLRLMNPAVSSLIGGSSTNANLARGRRYSCVLIDECFSIENFNQVYRSLQTVSRVKIFASSAKPGRQFEKFKEMCKEKGDYINLVWQDHPWKDEEWFNDLQKKAEFDPEVMREAIAQYSIEAASRYYPQIEQATIAPVEYDDGKPVYVFMDTGRSDLTVLGFAQYDGKHFNILEVVSNKNRAIDWYAPFINKDLKINPSQYTPMQQELLERVRKFSKPVAVFSGLDVKRKVMPTNKSIEETMYPLTNQRIIVNNYAEGHDARRQYTANILPLTIFNENSDGAMMLYDAIANSRYTDATAPTSKVTALKPVHEKEIADYRSAFEYFCTNILRVIRKQRTEDRTPEMTDTMSALQRYMKH